MNENEKKQERNRLEQTITALEAQRAVLGDAVVDTAVAPLRQQLQAMLAAERPTAQASTSERRVVSILFCDMVGSTTLAEHVDPEEWTRIMNQVFRLLTEPIDHYGGTVARLMGDAILALFGAPESHEDDPERAILAGLRILEITEPYRREFENQTGMSFDFRVGINTGLAVVGEVGSQLMSEYTAMGDAVNVAARMEQTAAAGTVQISEATYLLVEDLFDVKPLGPIAVKGRGMQVAAYQVLSRKSRSRRERMEQQRLVGRQDELKQLKGLAQRVRQGQGHIVMLIGEAGIGKSRLIAELRDVWTAGQPQDGTKSSWTEMSATSYSAGRPYGTFENQMRFAAGIGPNDPPEEARLKLSHVLAAEQEHEFLQSVYERLLGIHTEEQTSLSSEAFMKALYDSTLSAKRKESQGKPSVTVFDDVQWVDPASLGLIEHTLQLVNELPLLFLLATRPETEGPARNLRGRLAETYGERFTEIALEPLTERESVRLADTLFTFEGFPEPVRQELLARAEGNPYYIEELVQMVFDRVKSAHRSEEGAAAQPLPFEMGDLPANLMSLVASRMDRLPRETRQTLQLAAVIGRSFYVRVLRQISQAQAELEAHLLQLETAEMVREVTRSPEWEFIFRHALTQEAVYKTLLREQRQQFHRAVAQALEDLFPGRTAEFAPLLAHHFDEGGMLEKAQGYYSQAGSEAAHLHANEQALDYFRRALNIATQLERGGDEMIDLYLRLGRVLEHLNRYEEADHTYLELEDLGRNNGEPSMVLAGQTGRTILYANPTPLFDMERAESLGIGALELAAEIGDQANTARLNLILSGLYTFLVRYEEGALYGDRALAQARALGDPLLLAQVLNDLSSHLYSNTGDFRRSVKALMEARQLWRELGDKAMEADSIATLTENRIYLGEFDDALVSAEEGRLLSRSIHNLWGESHSQYMIGLVHWERGRPDRAIATTEESIRLAEASGFLVPQFATRSELALVYAQLGDTSTAQALLDKISGYAKDIPDLLSVYIDLLSARIHVAVGDLGAAERFLGRHLERIAGAPSGMVELAAYPAAAELALAQGESERALDYLERLLVYVRRSGARLVQLPALAQRAKVLLALDRRAEAVESAQEARALGESMGSRWTMWQVEAQLGRLSADAGEAQAHFGRARAHIDFILEHTPEGLRGSFLAREAVQSVLKAAAGGPS